MSKKFELGPTCDISGVEIFASGVWNGDRYTDADLDAMVDSFHAMKGRFKPYIKLGHDDKQKILQKDGYPAAGWIENLYRMGNKLVADIRHVPKKIFDLIKAGAYRRVSSEIFVNYVDRNDGDKKYPYLLKAVALLGGDTPAVQTLNDIMALFQASGGEVVAYEGADPFSAYEVEIKMTQEDKAMEKQLEQLNAQLAEALRKNTEAQAKIQELEGKNSAVKELTDKLAAATVKVGELETANAALKADVVKFTAEKNKAEITATLDKLVREQKITPAQKPFLFTMLEMAKSSGEKKFSVEGKELSMEELVLQFANSNAVGKLPTKPMSEKGKGFVPEGSPLAVVEEKIAKYQEEHKCDYKTALFAVAPEGLPNAADDKSDDAE